MLKTTTTKTIDFTAFSARLRAYPALAARFCEVLDLVECSGEGILNANKAEERAIEVLRDMGNDALHAWARRAAEKAAMRARDTGQLQAHLKKKVTWHTTFGGVAVVETQFRHKKTRVLLRPFSQAADVKCHGYSLPLERAVVDFGADVPYGQVPGKVKEHYGVELPGSAARTLTTRHARALKQHQVLPPKGRSTGNEVPCTLIAEVDGSMVPIVQPGVDGGDARKGKVLKWQEARLCTVRRDGTLAPTFGATLGSVQEAGALWRATAESTGLTPRATVHGIADGAPWIAAQFEQHFGRQGAFLVDFFHVCEYLAAAAKVCAPQEPEQWLERQKTRLKTSDLPAVLAELNAWALPVGVRAADGTQDPVFACLRYLSARRGQLDYAGALARELPIGSGEIESANRYIVQARLKRAGAWWTAQNAQAMLQLRTLRGNGQWDSYWETYREAA